MYGTKENKQTAESNEIDMEGTQFKNVRPFNQLVIFLGPGLHARSTFYY